MFIRPLILDPTAGKGGQGTALFTCALSSARHLIPVPTPHGIFLSTSFFPYLIFSLQAMESG
jgi:hypothetical protein